MIDRVGKVIAWKRTCTVSPSQWEGQLDDGRWFYGRYRWSSLSLGIGESVTAALRARRWDVAGLGETGRGDGWDGDMTDEEFAHRTNGILDWSNFPAMSDTP